MAGKRGLVYGVGVNDADYKIGGRVDGKHWKCPYYERWKQMLRRCYCPIYLNKQPTYKDCTVCDEWLTFSNFKAWMEQQDWYGKHLDKDLLVVGNKVYSPDTCVFVDQYINSFTTDRLALRGNFPLGVTFKNGKYMSRCMNPFTGKKDYLGLFDTPEKAHKAWRVKKDSLAGMLASRCEDRRLRESLINMYKQELEVVDGARNSHLTS